MRTILMFDSLNKLADFIQRFISVEHLWATGGKLVCISSVYFVIQEALEHRLLWEVRGLEKVMECNKNPQ